MAPCFMADRLCRCWHREPLCIFDPKTRVWPADPAEFYKAAADAGVVLKFNHPGDGSQTHDGLAYSEVGDKAVQLMEVRGEKEEQAFIRALNNGWHIAPDGSDDTHSPNWGNVKSWTGILAPGLSKRNILDALKNRRCFSTQDRNCELRFSINFAPMGTIIQEPEEGMLAEGIYVSDPEHGDTIAKVELFKDGKVFRNYGDGQGDRSENTSVEGSFTATPGKHYFFVKVTQTDGNLLWSAPIWVTVAE
jgi:hypothetical protein